MSITSRTAFNGRIAIIEIKGTLIGDQDADNLRETVADFIEQGNKALVVDMQKVNYLNSSGLGALISANSSYRRNGGEVKLARIKRSIQSVLAVTKLVDVFDICGTMDDAIDGLIQLKS